MIVVFESVLPVFAVIVLGFAMRKFNMVPKENWKIVEELCFWLLFPALLIKTLAQADFSSIETGPYTTTIIVFLCVMAVIGLALWPVLKKLLGTRPEQFSTVYQTMTRWNGFVALIIAIRLYGDDSLALMAISLALMTLALQVSNIFVLAAFTSGNRPSPLNILKTVASNPIIVSTSIGVFINLTGVPVWGPIIATLDLVGRAALGLSLLTIGAGLSLAAALRPSKELLVALIGKLFLSPLIMLACALWLGIGGLELSVLLVCASVPTAMNGYSITKKMGGDADLYAATATVQTVAAFITIPLVLWLGQVYFGAQ